MTCIPVSWRNWLMQLPSHFPSYLKSLPVTAGEVPRNWKKGNITPIHKKGQREDQGNYRSVSLSSVPRKITEQTLLEGMSKHMQNQEVIQDNQHNFMVLCDGTTASADKRRATDVIYLKYLKLLNEKSVQFDTKCGSSLTSTFTD